MWMNIPHAVSALTCCRFNHLLKTAEPAEEVAMETMTETNEVQTHQPTSDTSNEVPPGDELGLQGEATIVSAASVSSVEGSSVDPPSGGGSHPTVSPTMSASSSTSVPSPKSVKSMDSAILAGLCVASPEVCSLASSSGKLPNLSAKRMVSSSGSEISSESLTDSVSELSRLVVEMEEETPPAPMAESSLDKVVMEESGGVENGGLTIENIDQADLVDSILKESYKTVEDMGTKKEVASADAQKEVSSENQEDVTLDVAGEVILDNSEDNLQEDITLSTAADMEDDGCESNGSMSASTESEGFAEAKGEMKEEADSSEVSTEAPPTSEECNETKTEKTTPEKRATSETTPSKSEGVQPKSGKSKRKEDKSIEHILRALSSLQTTEEKLAALCKKYADLHEEHRILQASNKQTQRKLTVVTREKDQLQTEHTKAVMAKSKLESLCRELQKHNQIIRQESLQRAKEEDEKRKEISQKFQTTINDIQQQMQDNHERSKKLREENFELATKLKKFIENYEAREKQVEKIIQHRELEQKLADAKLEQANAILAEEQGRSQKEREMLILQSTEYMKKAQLKDAELTMYKERYEEFQSTITKSEEMFQKFKSEMDKMTKRIKKLEKEGAQWKSKWENANKALLEMAEEKTKYDKEKPILLNKITKLESLCRAMQAERQARKVLEAEGIDPDTISQSIEEKVPVQASDSTLPEVLKPPIPSGAMAGDQGSDAGTEESGETASTVIQQDTQPVQEESQSEISTEINGQPEPPSSLQEAEPSSGSSQSEAISNENSHSESQEPSQQTDAGASQATEAAS